MQSVVGVRMLSFIYYTESNEQSVEALGWKESGSREDLKVRTYLIGGRGTVIPRHQVQRGLYPMAWSGEALNTVMTPRTVEQKNKVTGN